MGWGMDRRATYQTVLPLALVGTLLTVALAWPVPAGEQAALFGLAGLLAALLVLSAVRRCPLWVLDAGVLAGGWTYVLSKLTLTLFWPDVVGGAVPLGELLPWFLVLLLAPGWLLGGAWGRRVSLSALGATLVLTAVFLAGPLMGREAAGDAVLRLLAQLLLAGSVAVIGQEAAAWRARDLVQRGAWAGLADEERDAVTGLPHGRALTRLLAAQLRPQRRPRRLRQRLSPARGLTVAVLRVDGLDRTEQERGVAFAEALRAHLARTLTTAVRHGDVVGCLDRESFAVLMRVPDARTARVVGERLRLRVASRPLAGVLPTVSVGVAVWQGQRTGRALLADAQTALECAREAGGNSVRLAPVLQRPERGGPGA